MKKLLLATALVAFATSLCSAQHLSDGKSGAGAPPPPKAGTPAPPPPPGTGKDAAMPAPPPPMMQETKTVGGRVIALVANDDYVYDGFWMQSNGDSILVKFPPHFGKQVVGLVQEGAAVSVSGAMGKTPRGTSELRLLTVSSGGKTVGTEAKPAASATPPAETAVSGSGKIASLQKDREGRIKGLVLDNGTILRMRPGGGAALGGLSGSGAAVSYTGMQHARTGGEAVAKEYRIVHCRTLTVDGKQYTL